MATDAAPRLTAIARISSVSRQAPMKACRGEASSTARSGPIRNASSSVPASGSNSRSQLAALQSAACLGGEELPEASGLGMPVVDEKGFKADRLVQGRIERRQHVQA